MRWQPHFSVVTLLTLVLATTYCPPRCLPEPLKPSAHSCHRRISDKHPPRPSTRACCCALVMELPDAASAFVISSGMSLLSNATIATMLFPLFVRALVPDLPGALSHASRPLFLLHLSILR